MCLLILLMLMAVLVAVTLVFVLCYLSGHADGVLQLARENIPNGDDAVDTATNYELRGAV